MPRARSTRKVPGAPGSSARRPAPASMCAAGLPVSILDGFAASTNIAHRRRANGRPGKSLWSSAVECANTRPNRDARIVPSCRKGCARSSASRTCPVSAAGQKAIGARAVTDCRPVRVVNESPRGRSTRHASDMPADPKPAALPADGAAFPSRRSASRSSSSLRSIAAPAETCLPEAVEFSNAPVSSQRRSPDRQSPNVTAARRRSIRLGPSANAYVSRSHSASSRHSPDQRPSVGIATDTPIRGRLGHHLHFPTNSSPFPVGLATSRRISRAVAARTPAAAAAGQLRGSSGRSTTATSIIAMPLARGE